MTAAQARLRKFLDNKIASYASVNAEKNSYIPQRITNEQPGNERILSLMGLSKLLNCTEDTDTDIILEPIESAFDDVDRKIANLYTQVRLSQFSASTNHLPEQINFNFNDLKPDFLNKLST